MLPRRTPDEMARRIARRGMDDDTLTAAAKIVGDVASEGLPALRRYASELDGLPAGAPLVIDRTALLMAVQRLEPETRGLLERVRERIAHFADAQRDVLEETIVVRVPGGAAGHDMVPVEAAGCYAPGGRYPLPSSVLMTCVTARTAGVPRVIVATPRPTDIMLAAAGIAGADALLAVGGAQAIAALAHGVAVDPVDVIVGPGNRWVTAAKQIVSDRVRIDMLAGPSELVVLADDTADPALIAADLLAQAEHDPEARVVLLTTSARLCDTCDAALADQLATLPTADVARASLAEGAAVLCRSLDEAFALCDRLAPEHLHLHGEVDDDETTLASHATADRLRHYGAVFIGSGAAEVIGDYGAGPNHVLPTAGNARRRGGLSVLDFLRVRTWLRIDDRAAAAELYADARDLADLEGLAAHARSATRRL